jgi:uncharacterized membrane protein
VSVIGYVQHLDTGALSRYADSTGGQVFVNAIPGDLVDPSAPIAWAVGITGEDQEASIRKCFSIGDTRSYDQDPRFGASVLAEIASRALSPAVNDPGTAIDVITRAMRVLAIWNEPVDPEKSGEVLYPNIHLPAIALDDVFDDLFTPIARDGAAVVEVGLRLQKAFKTLSAFDDGRYAQNARRHSADALVRAEHGLTFEGDRQRLRATAATIAAG